MALVPGSRLGVYDVVAPIGIGGMGEVYRATDTILGRQVAIKVLPDIFAHDPERLMRLEREARTLAALNHPNIAQIYGFEKSTGVNALVMELVDGPTLLDRIAQGAIPFEEALPIARQIAEALETAHEQGIVHRDLKPANIKVRQDGVVKVLDFGLAKALDSAPATIDASQSPTITSPAMMTGVGVLLGTAAYMSPEQARGKSVDKRADIWAFGAILSEMLTGTQLFVGETVADVLAGVLSKEPDFGVVPSQARKIIASCLEKDPGRRLRDIGDVWRLLDDVPGTTTTSQKSSTRAWQVATACLALFALGLIGALILRTGAATPLPPPETRTEVSTPSTSDSGSFALSPDGRQLVFVASGDGPSRLWLRPLGTTTAQPLAGTEGAQTPFWSADSRSLAFAADGKLKRLDLDGRVVRVLGDAGTLGGAWNSDGVILFSPNTRSPLFRMSASGVGEASAVTALDQGTSHRYPQFLPDGRRFIFYALGSAKTQGIYLAALDGGSPTRLTASGSPGVYMPQGWLLWVDDEKLVAQHLDVDRAVLAGSP